MGSTVYRIPQALVCADGTTAQGLWDSIHGRSLGFSVQLLEAFKTPPPNRAILVSIPSLRKHQLTHNLTRNVFADVHATQIAKSISVVGCMVCLDLNKTSNRE
jgi:hypothetical protein